MNQPSAAGSQSAAGLHERLRAATMAARETAGAPVSPPAAAKRRIAEASIWNLLNDLQLSKPALDQALSHDRALRRVIGSLLDEVGRPEPPVPLPAWHGRVLVVRSGPWPVLRALLDAVKAQSPAAMVSVLCHRRDDANLGALAGTVGLELAPVFYPRFEPFNRVTLERLLARQPRWGAAVALDGARTGTGRALEHVTSAMGACAGDRFVWNASGQLYRVRSLREALGREQYDLLRRLLRWHASRAPRQ